MTHSETDIYAFEQSLFAYKRDLRSELVGVGQDLAEEGERNVKQLMESLIYSQPESPSYERSRRLIDSANGFTTVEQNGISVTLEAFGGNENRDYALFVERGTYGSRVDLERIMDDARSAGSLGELAYGGTNGMRARPSVIPAIAEVERQAEDKLFEAQDKAWG